MEKKVFITITNKPLDLIERTFKLRKVIYLACNAEWAFFTCEEHKHFIYGFVKK